MFVFVNTSIATCYYTPLFVCYLPADLGFNGPLVNGRLDGDTTRLYKYSVESTEYYNRVNTESQPGSSSTLPKGLHAQ